MTSVASFARLPQTRPRKRHRLGQPVAADMPRRGRRGEAEFGGEAFHHRDALIAERGKRAGGAGEAHLLDARAELRRGDATWSISGCAHTAHFSPNVVGSACCRCVRPAITVWRCLLRLRRQRGDHGRQRGADQRKPVAHLQHGRGVHDVLRGGAPMRPAAGLARRARQSGDQPDHRIADIARAGGELLGAEVLDPCRAR